MLINLSNHPSHMWGKEQKEAAGARYGEVVDIAFPQIPPDADIHAVVSLAHEYAYKCLHTLNFTDLLSFDFDSNAVHIMGEMTFTYNVVRFLGHNDITCLASNTERISTEDGAGNKTSTFVFRQFREYTPPDEISY